MSSNSSNYGGQGMREFIAMELVNHRIFKNKLVMTNVDDLRKIIYSLILFLCIFSLNGDKKAKQYAHETTNSDFMLPLSFSSTNLANIFRALNNIVAMKSATVSTTMRVLPQISAPTVDMSVLNPYLLKLESDLRINDAGLNKVRRSLLVWTSKTEEEKKMMLDITLKYLNTVDLQIDILCALGVV